MSNPRIPRKPGQPANSKKHSDLYTDENPKGTIHGLGFKDVATAKASVSKIRNSSRSHAHKIQAAVAMEQRAREMGKSSEAAVYRKYINSMKKKTKKMNEESNLQERGDFWHPDPESAVQRDQSRVARRYDVLCHLPDHIAGRAVASGARAERQRREGRKGGGRQHRHATAVGNFCVSLH